MDPKPVLVAANPTGREPFAPDVALLVSLFIEPTVWDGRTHLVGNGQHRLCGARQAGVDRLLVSFT